MSEPFVSSYTDRDFAIGEGLAFVNPDGTVVMKGDNTTSLPSGAYRNR